MTEETALASPLTKLKGVEKRRTVESPRYSVFIGKGIAHGLRGSTGSSLEFIKQGKNDECVGEGKEGRPWHKPVAEIGVTGVVKKNVVVKPKPLNDRKTELPVGEKRKQEIITTSEHVDVHTKQSASDTMMTVKGGSKISEGAETSLLTEERMAQEIVVASDTGKDTAKETSSESRELDLFKKSCSLSKGKPTLLRLPSLISSGSSVGRAIDTRRSIEGKKSVDGKKILQGSKSFEGRKVVDVRKSLDGRKHSDESKKSADTEITQNGDGNASNVENKIEGSMSADEMKSTEGSKRLPAKNGLQKSKSLNLQTNIKDSGLVNAKNNGISDTLKKHVAAPKPKMLSVRPLRSLNSVAVKPSSLIYPSSGSRVKTSDDDQVGKKMSTSKLDAKKVSRLTTVSPSSSSRVNGEETSDAKKVRVMRVLPSVRIMSKVTKVAAMSHNDQGVMEDNVDSIKPAPEKKSVASTKKKMTSSNFVLPPAPSVSKSTLRSRISYLSSGNKKKPGETEQKIAAKNASPSGFRNGKAADGESENQKPSNLKLRSTTVVAETNQRRSYLKKDGPARDVHQKTSDKFLQGRPNIRLKKNLQVSSNKVIAETANRLIRTRKSKVLALIGAFETVISIQKKSSARAATKAKKRISISKVPR